MKSQTAPLKINMEPKKHPIEKENHLNQTSIFWGSMLILQGVKVSHQPVVICSSRSLAKTFPNCWWVKFWEKMLGMTKNHLQGGPPTSYK